MRLVSLKIITIAAGFISGGSAAHAVCRNVADLRIDDSSQVADYEDVCEVQNLMIFADNNEKVVLPNLKQAGLINIDSRGIKAIALPGLKHVRDLYITGTGMEVAEFPVLETVEGRLVVKDQNIKFLNLPELKLAGRVLFDNCPDLEFVFADKLRAINSFNNNDTPTLNQNSINMLANISILTEDQWQQRQQSAKRMSEYKVRLMTDPSSIHRIRPTGHKTQFRQYNNEAYYNWYPYEYDRYWWVIGAFGFQWYYWIR